MTSLAVRTLLMIAASVSFGIIISSCRDVLVSVSVGIRCMQEAVLMYGRVLRQTDEQRRTRCAAAAPTPLLGDDVTPDGNQHHSHHHRPGHHRHQTVVAGHEIFSDEMMSFSGQPVRRYL